MSLIKMGLAAGLTVGMAHLAEKVYDAHFTSVPVPTKAAYDADHNILSNGIDDSVVNRNEIIDLKEWKTERELETDKLRYLIIDLNEEGYVFLPSRKQIPHDAGIDHGIQTTNIDDVFEIEVQTGDR